MTEFEQLKARFIEISTARLPAELCELRDELGKFQLYPAIREFGINWSNDNNDLMATTGLPSSAPTMIMFDAPQVMNAEYVQIGSNNYGDRIIAVKSTGKIAYINHDWHNRVEYMNRDAVSLFRCICAFADMIHGSTDYPGVIKGIDQEAFQDGRWWKQEYLGWIETRKQKQESQPNLGGLPRFPSEPQG